MKKNKLSYLNDKIAKTVLAKEDVNIRNYVARIISHTTGIPYELLENNLSLVYPEVPTNGDVIKSTVDLAFTNNYQYFNIEIYYGKSKTERIKNVSYLFQLSLRQLKIYKNYKDLKPQKDAIINTDHGAVYFAYEYVELSENIEFKRSMSHKGHCWENSPIEN